MEISFSFGTLKYLVCLFYSLDITLDTALNAVGLDITLGHRHSTKRSAVTHLVHTLNFLRGGIHGLKRFPSETAQPEVFNTAVRVLTSIPVMHVFMSLSSKDRMTRIVHKYAPVRFVVRYGLKEHSYATKL